MQNFVRKKYCSNNTTTRVGLHLFLLSSSLRSLLAKVQLDKSYNGVTYFERLSVFYLTVQ